MSDDRWNDQSDDSCCPDCGSRIHFVRCYTCHPHAAIDRDIVLADLARLPLAERIVRLAGWIETSASVLALNLGDCAHGEAAFSARTLAKYVRLAGDGDLDLGIERLRTFEMVKRVTEAA